MTKSKISGVYQIQNKINSHKYIGSSVNIDRRWREHKNALRKNSHHSSYLQRAWNKYGESNFEFKILVILEPFQNLEVENLLLSFGEYNVSEDACAPMKGREHSEETRNLMSEAKEGKYNPMYGLSGDKSPRFGKYHSEDTKKKMRGPRLCMVGQNHPNYGKKLSKDVRSKLSDSHLREKNHNWISLAKGDIQKMRELREKGFTYADIGKRFNISEQTARRRILNISQASTI